MPCSPRKSVLLEEGNRPASVLTSKNSKTFVCAQALCSIQRTTRYCSNTLHFSFFCHPKKKKNQWMYNFLFVRQYFYPSPKMRISWVAPKKKRQNWKGGALTRVSKTIRGPFFNELFHLWQRRSQVQKWCELHDGCLAVNDTLLEVSTQFSVNKWLYKNSHYLRRPFSFQDKRTSGWKLQN